MVCVRCKQGSVSEESAGDIHPLDSAAGDLIHSMPTETISSALFPSPVYAANIFTVEADSVLQYVSAMTGDLNTSVTASVYLLNGDASQPEDGYLLLDLAK